MYTWQDGSGFFQDPFLIAATVAQRKSAMRTPSVSGSINLSMPNPGLALVGDWISYDQQLQAEYLSQSQGQLGFGRPICREIACKALFR